MSNSDALAICLIAAGFGLVVVLYRLSRAYKAMATLETELRREREARSADHSQWNERREVLEREISRLIKWQAVADADAKAAELLQAAQTTLENANGEAASLRVQAQSDADMLLARARADAAESTQQAQEVIERARVDAASLTTTARQDAKRLTDDARATLESATVQAKDIVDAAKKKAEEVAGSAYEAMKNAALYEQTVRAMKNLIEGYGDQYLVPERSLLDELADHFGHAEAGAELKKARERSKAMVRSGTAATCEYVETTRRNTAINFVTDAFNGKVDSILSRV